MEGQQDKNDIVSIYVALARKLINKIILTKGVKVTERQILE